MSSSLASWYAYFFVIHAGFALGILQPNYGVPTVCVSAVLLRYFQMKQWITPLFGGFAAVRFALSFILKAKGGSYI